VYESTAHGGTGASRRPVDPRVQHHHDKPRVDPSLSQIETCGPTYKISYDNLMIVLR